MARLHRAVHASRSSLGERPAFLPQSLSRLGCHYIHSLATRRALLLAKLPTPTLTTPHPFTSGPNGAPNNTLTSPNSLNSSPKLVRSKSSQLPPTLSQTASPKPKCAVSSITHSSRPFAPAPTLSSTTQALCTSPATSVATRIPRARISFIEEWLPPATIPIEAKATPTGYRPHPAYMSDTIIEGWPSPEEIVDRLKLN